ncbi:MAG: hypothetical protein WCS88_01405 [Patescibacteria group bacterium]|jgi:hypothetical protein
MKFKKHKLAIRWQYFVLALSLFSLAPMKSLALVEAVIQLVGGVIWTFFMQPFVWILELELELLKLVASYNGFTHEAGVTLGWIALRDLSNMFFILILLVISFATILRISSYGYQQLLKRTILVAILINFSKTIVGFFIDVVQVIMLTFISAINEIMSGGVVVAIGLHKFTTINPDAPVTGFGDYVVSMVLGAALVAILVVIVGVMVMMLMMRIVALWIAIIMAPLAFMASIFPATNSFYNTWTKQLGTNLVTGPMLAFFLWLTFSIVGNGNAYSTFMTGGGAQGATEFLDSSNMMNYIIAIALLMMGIKMAAASGAAGASVAAKGMAKIQSTAGHIARRYPKALAMRAGTAIAERMVDDKGKPKKDTLLGKFTGVATKVPFYGGKLQRGAMEMQGRNTARILAEHAEDTKYINPKQKEEFYRTQSSTPDKLKDIPLIGKFLPKAIGESSKVARATQLITSWGGGHDEAKTKAAIIRTDRKEQHDAKQAAEDIEALERINDQPRIDALHARYANTNTDLAAVKKDLNDVGSRKLLDKEADGVLDEDGKTTAGMRNIIRALLEDPNYEGGGIGRDVLNQFKKTRQAESEAFRQEGEEVLVDINNDTEKGADIKYGKKDKDGIRGTAKDKKDLGMLATEVNLETKRQETKHNNKGVLSTNDQNEAIKLFEALLQVYPEQAEALHEAIVGALEQGFNSGEVNFDNDSINHLAKNSFESEKDFEIRKAKTKEAWDKNNEEWQNSDKGKEATDKLYKTRRNLMGHYTNDEIKEEEVKLEEQATELKVKLTNTGLSKEERKGLEEELAYVEKSKLGLRESPVFKVMEEDIIADMEAAILANLGPRPERAKTVQRQEIDEDELDEKVEEAMKAWSPKTQAGFDGTPPESREKAEERVRNEIRERMEKQAEKDHKRDQKKENDRFVFDQANYDKEAEALRKAITSKLKDLNDPNNKNNLRIEELKQDIATEKAKPDPDKKLVSKLLSEQNSLIRLQNTLKRRELGLTNPNNKNLYSRAILKNGTDGSDYSRLEEMDIKHPNTRHLFEELAKVATVDQQRQILQAGNSDQIKLLAQSIVGGGGKLGKVVTDNLADTIRNELYVQMHVQKFMQEIPGITIREAKKKAAAVDKGSLSKIK